MIRYLIFILSIIAVSGSLYLLFEHQNPEAIPDILPPIQY